MLTKMLSDVDPHAAAACEADIYNAIVQHFADAGVESVSVVNARVVLEALMATAGRIIAACPEAALRRDCVAHCSAILPMFVDACVRQGFHPDGCVATEGLQ